LPPAQKKEKGVIANPLTLLVDSSGFEPLPPACGFFPTAFFTPLDTWTLSRKLKRAGQRFIKTSLQSVQLL
jgi:hypothetical protein